MKKVILYPRVSSKEQLKGYSIKAQIRRLTAFCSDNKFQIVDIYTDPGKSATFKDNKKTISVSSDFLVGKFDMKQIPAFKRIIHEAGSGKFDAIVFYKWDRAFRNIIFAKMSQQYLEGKGIELIPSDDSTDPLTSSIMQILSEEEIRKMKGRVRSSRLERFESGRMVARAPFGYRLNSKKKIEIDKIKADIVKKIFKMASEGAGYKEICAKFKIKPQSYYNIIRNRVYIGIIEFEDRAKKGVHEPLIDEELFYKVNK